MSVMATGGGLKPSKGVSRLSSNRVLTMDEQEES